VIWTTIPAVTMVALGSSATLLVKIKGRHSVPANAYPIAITPSNSNAVTYPGADGQLGTSDDFTVRNQLHVPVGVRGGPPLVRGRDPLLLRAVFRVKQDGCRGWTQCLVPGHGPGTYELGCAELCAGHYRMRAQVVVHTQETTMPG